MIYSNSLAQAGAQKLCVPSLEEMNSIQGPLKDFNISAG